MAKITFAQVSLRKIQARQRGFPKIAPGHLGIYEQGFLEPDLQRPHVSQICARELAPHDFCAVKIAAFERDIVELAIGEVCFGQNSEERRVGHEGGSMCRSRW